MLDTRSQKILLDVHRDLSRVVYRAAELVSEDGFEFIVTEGLRSLEKQAALKAKGASQTMKSRHLTGHAVDLAVKLDGEIRWDWPLYAKLAVIVKEAARIESVPVTWGGDWKTLKDGPHYELSWKVYP